MLPGTTFGAERLIELLWSRKLLLGMCAAAGIAAAAAISPWLLDEYRSEALIMVVPQRIPESYVKATVTEKVEDRLSTLTERLLSRTRLEQIISEFDLYRDLRREQPIEEALKRIRKDVKVTVKSNESLTISYTSRDPAKAQKVTERLASLFIQENARDRESQAENTNQFLDSQLDEAKSRLMDHEKKLEDYRRRYSGELPAQAASNLQVIQSADVQRQSLADAINRSRERRILLERQLLDLENPAPELGQPAPNPRDDVAAAAQPLEQRLKSAQAAYESLKLRKTPEHPDVRAAERNVKDLEMELRAQGNIAASEEKDDSVSKAVTGTPAEAFRQRRIRDLTLQIADLDRELQERADADAKLKAVVGDYQARLDVMPTRESELVELTRDYTTLQELYRSLLTKREESKISADLERQSAGEQFEILEPPQLPLRPFRPNRLLIYLGGLGGGLSLGLALTALFLYLDSGFGSEDDIARVLSLPVLAAIPVMKTGGDEGQHGGSKPTGAVLEWWKGRRQLNES